MLLDLLRQKNLELLVQFQYNYNNLFIKWRLKMKLVVNAGEHNREFCPVSVKFEKKKLKCEIDKPHKIVLKEVDTGKEIPVQCSCDGGDEANIWWIVTGLKAHETRTYEASIVHGEKDSGKMGVELSQEGSKIDITVGGKPLTTYTFDSSQQRPYMYPVFGPEGKEVTECPTSDHPHHRSLYVAYGEVNDVDVWSEGKNAGRIEHQKFNKVKSGPVVGEIASENLWVSKDGEKLMTDVREYKIYNVPEIGRIIDLDLTFIASHGDVYFGDTKEGGIISVRVAPSIKVSNTGKIENSFGGINEAETWGKKAHWCDYSGMVDDVHLGICVFDHIQNLRYPTYWHVRNYGLMGSNIFGGGTFEGDASKDGSYTLKAGEKMNFKFRVYIHEGDAQKGKVAQKYHDFINPPKVEVK